MQNIIFEKKKNMTHCGFYISWFFLLNITTQMFKRRFREKIFKAKQNLNFKLYVLQVVTQKADSKNKFGPIKK